MRRDSFLIRMLYGKKVKGKLGSGFVLLPLFVILLTAAQCSRFASALPRELLGVGVGMKKADAELRLRAVGSLEREEARSRQQIWRLADDSRFGTLAVGYDAEERVRFVAGIANDAGANKLRYSDVGDLSRASEREVSGGNYKYVWEIPARGEESEEDKDKNAEESPAYKIVARGNKPDYPMVLTLIKSADGDSDAEQEKEERQRK